MKCEADIKFAQALNTAKRLSDLPEEARPLVREGMSGVIRLSNNLGTLLRAAGVDMNGRGNIALPVHIEQSRGSQRLRK